MQFLLFAERAAGEQTHVGRIHHLDGATERFGSDGCEEGGLRRSRLGLLGSRFSFPIPREPSAPDRWWRPSSEYNRDTVTSGNAALDLKAEKALGRAIENRIVEDGYLARHNRGVFQGARNPAPQIGTVGQAGDIGPGDKVGGSLNRECRPRRTESGEGDAF